MRELKKSLRPPGAPALLVGLAVGTAAVLTACGPFKTQSEIDKVKETVKIVMTSNEPSICRERFTERFLESVSGRKGRQALAVCRRRQPKARSTAKSVVFSGVTIDGGHAVASFRIKGGALNKRTATATLVLKDGWRLDALRASAPVPTPQELRSVADRALRSALARHPGLNERKARCIVDYLRRSVSDAQLATDLKELRSGHTPANFQVAIAACRRRL